MNFILLPLLFVTSCLHAVESDIADYFHCKEIAAEAAAVSNSDEAFTEINKHNAPYLFRWFSNCMAQFIAYFDSNIEQPSLHLYVNSHDSVKYYSLNSWPSKNCISIGKGLLKLCGRKELSAQPIDQYMTMFLADVFGHIIGYLRLIDGQEMPASATNTDLLKKLFSIAGIYHVVQYSPYEVLTPSLGWIVAGTTTLIHYKKQYESYRKQECFADQVMSQLIDNFTVEKFKEALTTFHTLINQEIERRCKPNYLNKLYKLSYKIRKSLRLTANQSIDQRCDALERYLQEF